MQGRMFFRIMVDNLFVNNPVAKAISALVNFCNEQNYYGKKELKFFKKMSLNKVEKTSGYNKQFIFNGNQKSGV